MESLQYNISMYTTIILKKNSEVFKAKTGKKLNKKEQGAHIIVRVIRITKVRKYNAKVCIHC